MSEILNERKGIADCGTLLFTNKNTGEKQIVETFADVDFKIKNEFKGFTKPKFELPKEYIFTIEQVECTQELVNTWIETENHPFNIETIGTMSFEEYMKHKSVTNQLEKDKVITIIPMRKSKSKRVQKKLNKKYGFKVFSMMKNVKFDTIDSNDNIKFIL